MRVTVEARAPSAIRGGFRPLAGALAALAVALVPGPARALALLDARLALPGPPADLAAAPAWASGWRSEKPASQGEAAPPGPERKAEPAPPSSLDFDLLPEPPPAAPNPADGAMRLRRRMLRAHQGIGLVLLGLQLATTAVGQLNYSDRFDGGPSTARYQATHADLAYATLGVFALNGAIALLAPRAKGMKREGVDRVTVHELGMLAAAAGMAAEGALGVYTRQREGYLNQEHWARIHLAVGYATLAAVGVGVGALVF